MKLFSYHRVLLCILFTIQRCEKVYWLRRGCCLTVHYIPKLNFLMFCEIVFAVVKLPEKNGSTLDDIISPFDANEISCI